MKEIKLTQGKFAIVDDEDFEHLNQWKWCACKNKKTFYAVRSSKTKEGRSTTLLMHRVILNLTDKKVFCDHINGDGLDNRRSNLRPCTAAQNVRNSSISKKINGTLKGCSWRPDLNKWQARIFINKKLIHLGYFNTEKEAHEIWWGKASAVFGEFANKGTVKPIS